MGFILFLVERGAKGVKSEVQELEMLLEVMGRNCNWKTRMVLFISCLNSEHLGVVSTRLLLQAILGVRLLVSRLATRAVTISIAPRAVQNRRLNAITHSHEFEP
jgi:hypothetical protein